MQGQTVFTFIKITEIIVGTAMQMATPRLLLSIHPLSTHLLTGVALTANNHVLY
jgi:CO dehydrogenase/acetyl-CoA synthase delta subunit